MSSTTVIVAPFSDGATAALLLPVTATQTSGGVGLSTVVFGSAPGTSPIQGERIAAFLDDVDGVSPSGSFAAGFGFLGVMSRNSLYNALSATWGRARGIDGTSAAIAAQTVVAAVSDFGRVRDTDGNYALALGAYSTAIGNVRGNGASLSASPGEWSINSAPVAATQATVSRAAIAGTSRNVCRSITISVNAVAAQAPIEFVLRDGATGVGAILWRVRLSALAGVTEALAVAGLNIVGSANTQMTLESVGAPAATNFVSVSLSGYDALNS